MNFRVSNVEPFDNIYVYLYERYQEDIELNFLMCFRSGYEMCHGEMIFLPFRQILPLSLQLSSANIYCETDQKKYRHHHHGISFFLLHSRIFFMISSCAYLGGKKRKKKTRKVKKIQNRYDIFVFHIHAVDILTKR